MLWYMYVVICMDTFCWASILV